MLLGAFTEAVFCVLFLDSASGTGALSSSLERTFWLVCSRLRLSGRGLLEFALVEMLMPIKLLLFDFVRVAAAVCL